MCVHVHAFLCSGIRVEVRGQLCGVCSLHLYMSSGDSPQTMGIRVYQRNRSNGVKIIYYVIVIKPVSVKIAFVP